MAVLIATTVIAFLIAMTVVYALHVSAPTAPVIVTYFIVPLVVFILMTMVLSKIATPVNTETSKISYYMKNKAYETINQTSYMQIFPPILIVILGLMAVIGIGYQSTP